MRAKKMDQTHHLVVEVVHAGDVLDGMQDTHPRLGGLLHRADQSRTLTLSLLRAEDSGALDALEAASRLLYGTTDWVAKVPATLAAEFASRLTSDFEDGIDGVLENKMSAVLDPCRDLMELSVLFREFRLRPASFDQWQRPKEVHHSGEFGFGRLVKRFPDLPLTGYPDAESALTEYTQHSRTLHPQVPLTDLNELARAPAHLPELAAREWAVSMTVEVLRHTMITLQEFHTWHAERVDLATIDAHTEIDIDLDDIEAVHGWLERRSEGQENRIPADLADAFQAPYRRRQKPT